MIIIPAIDIKDGKCVRLFRGDFKSSKIVSPNPLLTAQNFEKSGAEYIHIVDLDGAKYGEIKNLKVIEEICNNLNIPIEFGGGIRNIETIYSLLNIGVSRVILGTKAVTDEKFLKNCIKEFKDKIAVGIDILNEKVAINGWLEKSEFNYLEFAKYAEQIGVKTIIATDIRTDGTLSGPNTDMIAKLKETVKINIISSGGISCFDDLLKLSYMDIYGAIVGKAFYSEKIKLNKEVFNAFKKNNSMS